MSKIIWDAGEQIASTYLESKGFEILEKNFRIRGGEIDIIAKNSEIYIFVEVKFRKNAHFVHPTELWNITKQKPFLRAFYEYISRENIDEDNCRIDFIGIIPEKNSHKIFWKKGVEIQNFEL